MNLGMIGAFNIRNALAATAILYQLGLAEDEIREAFESFQGVRRRLEFRAEVERIRIYEDFAHHPTAVRETLEAMRHSFNPQRLWAIYEPRSATSRRKVFQREIAEALGLADCVVIPGLFKAEKIAAAERLDPQQVVDDLRRLGRLAWHPANVEGIIETVCREARSGDWIVIMSNGGFGGIYERLPDALAKRDQPG